MNGDKLSFVISSPRTTPNYHFLGSLTIYPLLSIMIQTAHLISLVEYLIKQTDIGRYMN